MTDITPLGGTDDVAFVRQMIEHVGVAAVPGSSFYADRARGRTQVRFAFPKRVETLRAACERLARLPAHMAAVSVAVPTRPANVPSDRCDDDG
jgi:aminotransferase